MSYFRSTAVFAALVAVSLWPSTPSVSSAHASVRTQPVFPRQEAPPADPLLAEQIAALMRTCPGEPSVVVLSEDGRSLEHNSDEIVKAASVIKLPIMAALFSMGIDLSESITVLRQDRTRGSGSLKFGALPRTFTALTLIEHMMIESDNTATNALLRHYGQGRIESEFVRLGMVRTGIPHRILESGRDNPTTADEMALLLKRLDEIPGAPLMRSIMRRCSNNRRLARHLGSAEFAHKTGTLRSVVHDAGIISTRAGDVVVVAMISRPTSQASAERWLGELGRTVYDRFR